MLSEVADGVFVRQSEFCLSNAIVVRGESGLLVVDPGVDTADIDELIADLSRLGQPVVAGFATHPHWDHLLWHPALGDVPRYATAHCVITSDLWLDDARSKAAQHAPGAPTELLGQLTALPGDSIPWDGRTARVFEHQGHAPGHAALRIEPARVLLVGDMLSDVEIPLLDLEAAGDSIADYDAALDVLENAAQGVTTLVPGHGDVADEAEIASRLAADRAYLEALTQSKDPHDPRVGPAATYGRDWLVETHERQLERAGG